MVTFSERVIKMALSIPKGRVSTYGRIAKAAGGGGQAARSITGILGKATESGVKNIPYHRIVYTDGVVWLDDVYGKKRLALYKKEGIKVETIRGKHKIKDFYKVVYDFK